MADSHTELLSKALTSWVSVWLQMMAAREINNGDKEPSWAAVTNLMSALVNAATNEEKPCDDITIKLDEANQRVFDLSEQLDKAYIDNAQYEMGHGS